MNQGAGVAFSYGFKVDWRGYATGQKCEPGMTFRVIGGVSYTDSMCGGQRVQSEDVIAVILRVRN